MLGAILSRSVVPIACWRSSASRRQRGHRDRRVLQGFLTTPRRDDDGFQGFGFGRLRLGRGLLRRGESADDERRKTDEACLADLRGDGSLQRIGTFVKHFHFFSPPEECLYVLHTISVARNFASR